MLNSETAININNDNIYLTNEKKKHTNMRLAYNITSAANDSIRRRSANTSD